MKETVDRVSRAVSWVVFAFAVGCMGFGALVWFSSGGQDAGGILGFFFIAAGLVLAIPALSFARTGQIRGLLP